MIYSDPDYPTWSSEISQLFSAPPWIDPQQREATGLGWKECMAGFGIHLDDYESVRTNSVLIYEALASRWMPLGEASWPDAPLETLRAWVNQGWRLSPAQPLEPAERIPPPPDRPFPIGIRKDLRALTQDELDDYRMRLDERFQVADPDPAAPGQVFFAVHGEWCLHYQEAFLLWHRAYLLRFEQALGCRVPYWNWYAAEASVDGTAAAGLPQPFKDETYLHPGTGEVRPNPLRYAAARLGASKACVAGPPGPGVDCRWVQRDPILYTSGDDHRPEREKKLAMLALFQQQVRRALAFGDFSHPEGGGYPWANIQSFDPPPPDSDYVYRDYNFDGAYEQPHDNFHGWVGPDMADNSYTAYDPVFWSYHANIDRIFEAWLRAHPQASFTAGFPLHPFTGARAEAFEFTDPRPWTYTMIGDLARDSRGLGYDYGSPVDPDVGAVGARCPRSTLGASLTAAEIPEKELLIVFDGVRCTLESYAIDLFLDAPDAGLDDVHPANPHYVGRMTRLGMGQQDTRNRCITVGVPRILEATTAAAELGIGPPTLPVCTMIVRMLADGSVLAPADYADLPGFAPRLVWARRGWAPAAGRPAVAASSCCSSNGH